MPRRLKAVKKKKKRPLKRLFHERSRYDYEQDEIINEETQRIWGTQLYQDFKDKDGDKVARDFKAALSEIMEKLDEYWRKGYKFDTQWMIDYLCLQHVIDETPGHWCHNCTYGSLENDSLVKCRHCDRHTHHVYNCSKAGAHNPTDDEEEATKVLERQWDLPNDQNIESMWCCWRCMWEKEDPDQAWLDESRLSDAMESWRMANGLGNVQNDAEHRRLLALSLQARPAASDPAQPARSTNQTFQLLRDRQQRRQK